MPFTTKASNNFASWDLGLLGGDFTGATVVTNSTGLTAHGSITLQSVQQAADQVQSKFWKQLLGIANGYPNAQSVVYPTINYSAQQSALGAQTQTGWGAISQSTIVTTSVPVDQIYYMDAHYNQQMAMGGWLGTPSLAYTTLSYGIDETPEERQARKVREADRMQKRKDAEKRAEALLVTMLSDEQIIQYQKHGYFETEVKGKVYRITKGRSGNVQLIENNKPKYKYCAHPSDMTPDQDVMLSQMLMLHTDEDKFLATANRTIIYN